MLRIVIVLLTAMASLPSNVHISRHPCLRAKLSQLRSKGTNARDTKILVHEIALILGVEALAELDVTQAGTVSPTCLHPLGSRLIETQTDPLV